MAQCLAVCSANVYVASVAFVHVHVLIGKVVGFVVAGSRCATLWRGGSFDVAPVAVVHVRALKKKVVGSVVAGIRC